MKDTTALLRRIDEEITGREQQIAMHQVEIMRLTTTRRTLMSLAEADIEAAERSKFEHQDLLPGSTAKPMLVVRKIGSGEEEKPPAKERRGRRTKGQLAVMRERILAAVDGEPEGFTMREISNHLGITEPRERHRMWNAVYGLQKAGQLGRLGDKSSKHGRYFKPAMNGAGAQH